jgi:hypothetical protein
MASVSALFASRRNCLAAVDVSSLASPGNHDVSVFVVGIVAITSLLDRGSQHEVIQLASVKALPPAFPRSLSAVYRHSDGGFSIAETCAKSRIPISAN